MKNFLSNLFGRNKMTEKQDPVESQPIEAETSKYSSEESLNSKLHREYFAIYDLNGLYGKKVSGVISYYQKMCQENSKINIIEQIDSDIAKLGLPIFLEFQEKLKQTQEKVKSNQIELGDKAIGIFNALKSVFGIS